MNPAEGSPVVRHASSRAARIRSAIWMVAVLFLCIAGAQFLAGSPSDVPTVSAGLGPCTADFTVVDASSKPVFNSTIHVKFAYGFMGKRDTDLEVGTNSDGKAHFEGLPSKLKKPPMVFTVQKGDQTQSVTNDPAANCHPYFNITLGK